MNKIIEYMYGQGNIEYGLDNSEKNIRNLISQINKRFSEILEHEKIIQNERGIGYRCSYALTEVKEDVETELETLYAKSFSSPAEYCQQHGILGFSDQAIEPIPFLQNKSELYILSTTGINLIRKLAEQLIPEMLEKQGNIHVIIANKHSDFIEDVEVIEGRTLDLSREFTMVIEDLQRAVVRTRRKCGTNPIGKIFFGCSFTLLRQTITMGIDRDQKAWGCLSLTLPPRRTISGTSTFAFEGDIHDKNSWAFTAYQHFMEMKSLAESRNAWVEITENINPQTFYFRYSRENATRRGWESLQSTVQMDMQRYHEECQGELIEVAAQHPLQDGKPGLEFRFRLDYAYELYQQLVQRKDAERVHIYIPGSLHGSDACALSDAGVQYLMERGIPRENLMGDEKNREYKGNKGVYNSADECYVASIIFLNGRYRHLRVVCSPNQMMRKQLFYLQFHVIPMFYTVPVESEQLFHNPLYEVFDAIPNLLYYDKTWQDEDSFDAIRTRTERQPGFSAKKTK
ncbi:MAG: hypothetical protein MJ071_09040 [Oscillospiraceae bacterium]|nr:hypothetical protein [Oscillospiraceae bacterium]